MTEALYELLQVFLFHSYGTVKLSSTAPFSGITTYQKQSRLKKNLDKSKYVILTDVYG